jgi:hypothetical protein
LSPPSMEPPIWKLRDTETSGASCGSCGDTRGCGRVQRCLREGAVVLYRGSDGAGGGGYRQRREWGRRSETEQTAGLVGNKLKVVFAILSVRGQRE